MFLFLLNVSIAWRLFRTEYLTHFGSLEPVFFALAHYIKAHWSDPGWLPFWFGGMPLTYVYQPGLHYVVAFASAVTGWSEGRAFHFVVGLGYSLGAVSVYLLALRLSRKISVALGAGLLFSLWSPSAFLMPEIRAESGWLGMRRLHAMVVYGDAPHVMGLVVLPIAILLLDRTVERASAGRIVATALGMAAVALSNIPATIALGFAVCAYLLSAAPRSWPRRVLITVGCAGLGYALVAAFIPPSALQNMAQNVRWMAPEANVRANLPIYGVLAVSTVAIAAILHWIATEFYVRFAALLTLLPAAIVLGKSYFNRYLIAQPSRFHLFMEMGICLLVAWLLYAITRTKRIRIAVPMVLTLLGIGLYAKDRLYARKIVQRASVEDRSEWKIAQWFLEHKVTERVYVPGSDSFWLNAFVDTPQLAGCCDQSILARAPQYANYIINSDDAAGDNAAMISVAWLKAMGVRYAVVSGPRSTEVYKAVRHPLKFDGVLPEVWRDGDDVIYDVSPQLGSLAHFVRPDELVMTMPVNGIDVYPLGNFAAAVTDPARPAAGLAWTSTRTIVIHGHAATGDALSVQIPFHPGWHASTATGGALTIRQDALGLMFVSPNCEGECAVNLTYDGGDEQRVLRLVMAAAWLGVLAALVWDWRARRSKSA